jgi:hypothetical protein
MSISSTYKKIFFFLLSFSIFNIYANDITPLNKVEIISNNSNTGFAKL